jgi:hypothetical protein
MHRWLLALALAILALTVVACGLLREPADAVIDGWTVGTEVSFFDSERELLLGLARDHLDRRDRGHAPVVRATLHIEGGLIDPATGQQILRTRSGGAPRIAVFELADGTVTAIGVGYPGISREPVVLGP